MLSNKAFIQNRPNTPSLKFPGLQLGVGKYAEASSNSTLDDFTAFTIGYTINFSNRIGNLSAGQYLFSCFKSNNAVPYAGNDTAGAMLYPFDANNNNALTVTSVNGGNVDIGVANKSDNNQQNSTSDGTKMKRGSSIVSYYITGDGSSNTVKIHTLTSTDFQDGISGNHNIQTDTGVSFSNWGTFGTDGYIVAGGFRSTVATTSAGASSSDMFLRAQIWDSVLTDEQIKNTIGGDPKSPSLPSYSEGNYPQPLHEWIPVIGNNLTIPDTGSDTAINLTINGSAKVGYFPPR